MAQFTNQAQLNYNGITKNSNIAVGELRETLTAAKTALRTVYSRNDTITYVLSYANSSQNAVGPITVTDNLGAYSFGTGTVVPLEYTEGSLKVYTNGVLQTSPTATSGPPLVISGITIPANGNAVIVYETKLTEYAPLNIDAQIINTVTASGTSLGNAITATETVTAAEAPELSITKSVSPVPVSDGEVLTYTFVIQNYGNTPATASDNVVLSDTFNPVLSDITAVLDSRTLVNTTDYTYNSTTGVFNTTAGVITVPAATFTQDATSGAVIVTPGVATLTISGTV